MKIFVCIESYLPGTLGGGPVRALANLIEHFGEAHTFFVFTRNHDYLTAESYAGISPNTWQPQASASVYYCGAVHPEHALAEQLSALQPDWIYLNGALPSLTRACLALRQNDAGIGQIPVLLAPHGNLSQAALVHHRFRKAAWLWYAKLRSLYRDVIWHAASDREADQIRAVFGSKAQVRVVPMAPAKVEKCEGGKVGTLASTVKEQIFSLSPQPSALSSPASPLHFVYFGRLSSEKNIPFAFDVLARFAARHPEQTVVYDLIGSGEPRYEAKLRSLSADLPDSVQVNFIGQLTPKSLQAQLQPEDRGKEAEDRGQRSEVRDLRLEVRDLRLEDRGQRTGDRDPEPGARNQEPLSSHPSSSTSHSSLLTPHSSRYHAMLMPSLTENFSYTVLESWQAGIPVLISDQTPWRGLEAKGVGWDLSLEAPDQWLQAVEQLSAQPASAQLAQSQRASAHAAQWGTEYARKAATLFDLHVTP